MSSWYDAEEARRKQQKQQEELQRQLDEQQRVQERQQQEARNQQIVKGLHDLSDAVDAVQRLEFIRQRFWGGYGIIHRHQGQYKYFKHPQYYLSYLDSPIVSAGYVLHFDYEVVQFVKEGGYETGWHHSPNPAPVHWTGAESKKLLRIMCSKVLAILAEENINIGSKYIRVFYNDCCNPEMMKSLYIKAFSGYHIEYSTSTGLPSVKQSLDKHMYDYCQYVQTPMQILTKQQQENQEQENAYRQYKPRLKR